MQEYVNDGEVGALVAPGDAAGLAQALAAVLPRAAEMADACRLAAAPFASEHVSRAIAGAFADALAAGAPTSAGGRGGDGPS